MRQLSDDDKDEPWHGSPLVVDDKVVVFAGRLFALSAKSGEVLWKGDDVIKEGVHGSPALAEFSNAKLVIAHIGQGETVAVDLASGKDRWRVKTEASASTPVIHGDLMVTLAHSRKGGVRCFRISTDKAEPLWDYQSLADPGASPVIVGDHVYVQGEKKLACLSLADGKPAWTADLNVKNPRYTSLIAADGQVLYAFDSLLSFAADPKEFQQLYHGRFKGDGLLGEDVESKDAGPHTCTSPAIADGRLYLRLRQGIACYDLRK
jgi:outer membrane protein assembly factor BamB